jgi:hypothetical protein
MDGTGNFSTIGALRYRLEIYYSPLPRLNASSSRLNALAPAELLVLPISFQCSALE